MSRFRAPSKNPLEPLNPVSVIKHHLPSNPNQPVTPVLHLGIEGDKVDIQASEMSATYGLQLVEAAMAPPRLQYLPTELIKIVVNHLTLADAFTLSQVNSRLRAIATQDWRKVLAGIPRHERIHFDHGLAHVRANYWACDYCIQLHEIDPTDIPSNRPESRHGYDGFYHLYTPKPCKTDHIEVFGGAWTWNLRETHIQLALKLTRILAGSDEIAARAVKRAHLRKLMKPFNLKLCWKYAEPTHFGFATYSDPSQRGLATPRIVDGRFLLRMEWRYRNDDRLKMGWRAGSLNWSICPHQPCLSRPEKDADVMAILPYECGDRHTSYWGLSDAHKSYFSDDGPGPVRTSPK